MKKFIIIGALVIVCGAGAYVVISSSADTTNNQNIPVIDNNQNSVANTNEATNENTNTVDTSSVVTNQEIVLEGTAYTRGYDTPSESFGMITATGYDIGFGQYDSAREQVRPYIGEKVKVTFEKICKSSSTDCCRTLFPLCGTIQKIEGIE